MNRRVDNGKRLALVEVLYNLKIIDDNCYSLMFSDLLLKTPGFIL